MSPFDIQSDFASPAAVGRRQRASSSLVHLGEYGIGQAKLCVEGYQVTGDVGIVVGINNGNGRAGPIQVDLVEAIGMADLAWCQSARTRASERRRSVSAGAVQHMVKGSEAGKQSSIFKRLESKGQRSRPLAP